jgi:hypothetical protein
MLRKVRRLLRHEPYLYNSFMSALADVLGRVANPGAANPPQRGALEQVRDWLVPQLDADAGDRVATAFETLIRLRHIRVSTQHADARHKAVDAFRRIGVPQYRLPARLTLPR